MNTNLALPKMSLQSTPSTEEATSDIPEWLNDPTIQQEFEEWMAEESSSNTDTDMESLLEPDQTANSNQILPFSSTSIPPLQTMPFLPPQIPAAPDAMPDVSIGPSFHPMIGWYFPALPMSGLTTPVDPFLNVSEGFTPMSITPVSAVPSGTTTPNAFLKPPKPKGRRKYGPAAFLEEQAKTRLENNVGPRDLPPAPATLPVKKQAKHPLRDRKNPSLVKACICNDKQALKIKRPKNAFILYRSAHSAQIIKRLGENDNQAVSRIAADNWKNASVATRQKFFDLAKQEKERHEQMYPDYKYQPGISNRNKFGSASCQCGAYAANMAALPVNEGNTVEDDASDLYEYVPPGYIPAGQAPTAQMTQTPLPDFSNFNFSTPAMRNVAPASVASMKRKREAAIVLSDDDEEQPVAKRRSPRIAGASVTYTEEDLDRIFGPMQPEPTKQHPSQTNSAGFEVSPSMSDVTMVDDSPARNTRSNSLKAKTPSPQPDLGVFNFGSPMQDADWLEIFGANGLINYEAYDTPKADGESDSLFVKDSRPSSRGKGSSPAASPRMVTRSRQQSNEEEPVLRRSSRKPSK